ncbi:hypothetical protein SOVF_046510 [Spinacia oleracea]|uniref:Uncharacterized protein n=1 Tax=Spinacia oleracea TaxID=3562 RepID=A0A9R0I645_SPIOL|nr:uncharacterized protein LOC110783212 [Spinacia oleracea]KNA21017.1 hypothetical protein SOVF_046510 [Spinacia oleracea]
MASVQQAQVDSKFNDKQKAAIGKAMQDAQSILANNEKDGQHQLAVVGGVMQNLQRRVIVLKKTHDAEGRFLTNPPGSIGGEGHGAFVHQGATSQGPLPVVVGSKCAIIYGTIDKMAPALGYLLAWNRPDDANQDSKVYVEAGSQYNLEKMEWSEIEKKLDASTNKSQFIDHETGATATAEIKDNGNKRALVAASFDRITIGIPIPN